MNGWKFHTLRRNVTREAQIRDWWLHTILTPWISSQTEIYNKSNWIPDVHVLESSSSGSNYVAFCCCSSTLNATFGTSSNGIQNVPAPTSALPNVWYQLLCGKWEESRSEQVPQPPQYRSQGTMPPCAFGSSTWLRVWERLHLMFYLLHVSSLLMCHMIKGTTCSNDTVTMCKTSVLFITDENISITMTLKMHQ